MEKKPVKIVTIGGGSSYTPELVEGFINRYDSLPIKELCLVDIPEGKEKLETVGALAQRMVKKAGVPMKVTLSYDRREALKDADFVTTQMRIGRLPARILDERIPISHELIGQENINEYGVEVNKGGLDTITNNTPIAMISEYPYGLSSLKRVTNGTFLVQNGMPKIKYSNGNTGAILEYFNYITQNPYNKDYINGLDTLHNFG